jgi:Uncharacterized protein conserved in bacteria
MINEAYEKVALFQEFANQPVSKSPRQLDPERVITRAKWMMEELAEFVNADSVYAQADSLTDLLYYLLGAFVEMGIKPDSLFEIVHSANMGKVTATSGIITDSTGKVQKPPEWKHPDEAIKSVIDSL